MANFQIPGKTAITSVDGAADVMLIYDDSATALKKTTRNTLLNIASQPLGLTDTQSPTNKTFDNTNIFTIRDDRLTLQDSADTTKQAVLQLSGITTGTTRTYTLPDASSTLVDLSSTQTLTNKTLTSPTINTATISNPTLTVDTVSEHTAANGVTVDGLNIKDGKLNTNNSVVTANITDAAVTPAKLVSGTGSSWTWQTYTPTWTNLTVGNGTVTGRYTQIGKFVSGFYSIVFGTTSAVSGQLSFTLPVTSTSYSTVTPIGNVYIDDVSTASYIGTVNWLSTTTANFYVPNGSGDVRVVPATTNKPIAAYGVGDSIKFSFFYEAA